MKKIQAMCVVAGLFGANQASAGTCVQIDQVANGSAMGSAAAAAATCGPFAIAIGGGSGANAQNMSVAIGDAAVATGQDSVGVGRQLSVTGASATGVGSQADAAGDHASAFGQGANASAAQALALGAGSVASNAGAVALGAGSTTDAAVATSGVMLNGTNYTFAGTAPGSTVSVGSVGAERTVTNLAAGRISGTSTDAVNGSQLYATNQTVALLGSQLVNLSNTVNNLPAPVDAPMPVDDGSANPTYNNSSDNAAASSATGKNATAVGAGAAANGDNSVALGAGSVASSSNSVSVGSAGHERTITNVANGVNPTDAANVGQVNQALEQAKNWSKDYVDQRFQSINRDLNRVGNRANAGVASAMAMAGLGQAYQADQSSTGIALGTFQGETAFAVGLSTISESGRYIFKLNGTTNSRGDAGASVGATMVW